MCKITLTGGTIKYLETKPPVLIESRHDKCLGPVKSLALLFNNRLYTSNHHNQHIQLNGQSNLKVTKNIKLSSVDIAQFK